MILEHDLTNPASLTKKQKVGPAKRQGYNARLDESLGARRGAESTKDSKLKSSKR